MRKDSKLLINEPPLQVLPTLAKKIGLNEAIVLQQVHYWLVIAEKAKDDRKFKDGRWWVYNTYQEWQENFPWWSLPTIKRTILSLEEAGLLISQEMNKQDWDHTKWYTVNYDKLDGLTDSIKMIPSSKPNRVNQSDQDESLLIESETTTETTTEIEIDRTIFKALEELTGGLLKSDAPRYVDTWKEKHPLERIIQAIDVAKSKGRKPVEYVDSILIGWEANGYPKSREQQVQERKGNKPNANTPRTTPEYTPADYELAAQIRASRGLS